MPDYWKSWPEEAKRRLFDRLMKELAKAQVSLLSHQRPPSGLWLKWLLLAGRGAGKTQAGAAWSLSDIKPDMRVFIVAPTFSDVRDTCFEGPSGIMAVARLMGLEIEYYNRGTAEARISGALIKGYSADQPDRLRGPQCHRLWMDELAAMRRAQEAYDMAMMGLRLGDTPQALFTTTPRPIPLIKALMLDKGVVVTKASTFDNPHLPEAFKGQILDKYKGTRLGRQELQGEVLEDVEGALWTLALLEQLRVDKCPPLTRVVVAVDPPATSSDGSAEAGIVVCGIDMQDHKYILDDLSKRARPAEWGAAAVLAFDEHKADRIIYESNQGGEMVAQVISSAAQELFRQGKRQTKHIPLTSVYASRGKRARAEPIAALYEQGKVHHVGIFPQLEEQMTTWRATTGEASPDRLDALVWGLHSLGSIMGDTSGYKQGLAAAKTPSSMGSFSAYSQPF